MPDVPDYMLYGRLVSVRSPDEFVCKCCNKRYHPLLGTPEHRTGCCEDCLTPELVVGYEEAGYRRGRSLDA